MSVVQDKFSEAKVKSNEQMRDYSDRMRGAKSEERGARSEERGARSEERGAVWRTERSSRKMNARRSIKHKRRNATRLEATEEMNVTEDRCGDDMRGERREARGERREARGEVRRGD